MSEESLSDHLSKQADEEHAKLHDLGMAWRAPDVHNFGDCDVCNRPALKPGEFEDQGGYSGPPDYTMRCPDCLREHIGWVPPWKHDRSEVTTNGDKREQG